MSHKVDVIGPISGSDKHRTGHSADYHVHAANCPHAKRYHAEHWRTDAASQLEIAGEVFSDIMDESGEPATAYSGEFWFAPCCDDLPDAAATDQHLQGVPPKEHRIVLGLTDYEASVLRGALIERGEKWPTDAETCEGLLRIVGDQAPELVE